MGLVADIGGTNARFVALDLTTGETAGLVRYATAEYGDSATLLRQASDDLAIDPQACLLAVAGPCVAGRAELTNGALTFDKTSLEAVGYNSVELINDFVAMSRAVPEVRPVSDTHVSAVIGPGTGLGVGFLVPTAGGLTVCPSEGGAAAFAPADELEQELLAVLRPAQPTLSWENLISGPGLVTLYKAVCAVWGAEAVLQQPEDISAKGLEFADPVCHKCLEVFCGMLGSLAGNVALTLGARGGVFLVGDLLGNMEAFFTASQFRQRFETQGAQGKPWADLLEQIPTELITQPDLGLTGATHFARDLWVHKG